MAADYPLADELKSEFRDRGAAVSGMQASTTSELMHRAEMGNNPRVNVAEQAFRENYRARQNAFGQAAPSRPPRPRSSGPRPGMQNGANPSDPPAIPPGPPIPPPPENAPPARHRREAREPVRSPGTPCPKRSPEPDAQ